jgi:DNA-binding NtrC family response regulator
MMGHQVDAAARDFGTRATASAPVVLVCDDETRLATLTAELLEGFGFQTIAVGSGSAAVEKIEAAAPAVSVVLLDVNLSLGGSAADILEQLTSKGSNLPVVLTSGQPKEDAPVEVTGHPNVIGYLEKPYTADALQQAIRAALGG